jgi:hypothetical protein
MNVEAGRALLVFGLAAQRPTLRQRHMHDVLVIWCMQAR